jgi:uncharacterized membrane protein
MADRFDSGRMEAFSDGVFAIAITLLVLDISVPAREFDDLWAGIADQWPSYLAYVTSFATIGGLWSAHHALFRRLRYADATLMRLNLLLLLAVSFLPFPTSLVGDGLRADMDAERTAVLFYGAALFVISSIVTAMCRYAVRRPELLLDGASKAEVDEIGTRTQPTLAFYGLVILLAFLAPRVAAFGFLVIAVAAVMRRVTAPQGV